MIKRFVIVVCLCIGVCDSFSTNLAVLSTRTQRVLLRTNDGMLLWPTLQGKPQKARTTSKLALNLVPSPDVILPSLSAVSLACLVPTLSGLIRREYTVSYAYGTAVAATAILVMKSLAAASVPINSIAFAHALALAFYGIRLDIFLLYREIFIPRFRKLRERIEEKAPPGSRLKRLPFILGCSALYGFMAAPLFASGKLMDPFLSLDGGVITNLLRLAVGSTWGGFVLGAMGDVQKSVVKATKGEDTLVTGGVYGLFRHPNYTGELIAWSANGAAAFLSSVALGVADGWPLLVCTVLGVFGINTVLMGATAGLEKRQAEKYGDSEEYKEWVKTSWVGFVKKSK